MVFICAVRDATAAAMWLWSSRPSWLRGDLWVGDIGGVFWLDCLGRGEFSGIEGGSIAFFGVSGLGSLGGRFGVVGSQGEAVRDSWAPGASPILISGIGLAMAMLCIRWLA